MAFSLRLRILIFLYSSCCCWWTRGTAALDNGLFDGASQGMGIKEKAPTTGQLIYDPVRAYIVKLTVVVKWTAVFLKKKQFEDST